MQRLMALQALVLSRDTETVRVMRAALNDLSITCEASMLPERATELLAKRKFDAVVVDCDDVEGAPEVLRELRKSPSNKRAMAFAVVNGTTTVKDAFEMGANFVLDKPLTAERAMRSLRAAHGLMKREHRRYFRTRVEAEVQLITPGGQQLRGTITNLSEGGVALQMSEVGTALTALKTSVIVKLRFALPGRCRLEAKGEVIRADSGRGVGLRFLHLEQKMQRELEQWLGQQMEQHKPPAIFINATARAR
jgi:DNA-binding NarL/FixJ family response regulator